MLTLWRKIIPEMLIVSQLFRQVHNIAKTTISFVMSVRLSAKNNSVPAGRIFFKFCIWEVFENMSRKFIFDYNLTRITGTLHENLHKFMIISCWITLRKRNISTELIEKIKTHILYSVNFFENRAVSEIMWKNTKCVVAFPLQQWLCERVTILRYTYFACFVKKILLFYEEVCTVIRN